jgi:hypothetical protein
MATRFFELVLVLNGLLFLVVLLYAIGWAALATARGRWQAANGQFVSRPQNPHGFWAGIVLVLALAMTLFLISSALVYYRLAILRWFAGH